MSTLVTCEHLQPIEASIRASGVAVVASGDWWGEGLKNRIYFNCVLDRLPIEHAFGMPSFVEWYEYDGRVAGVEAGFHCKECNSLLVGGLYGGKLWSPQ